MKIPPKILEDLGALWRKLKDPEWVAAEGTKAAASIYVIGPTGSKVKAQLSHRLFDNDLPTDVHGYKDSDGNEYIVKGGEKYYHDPVTDTFTRA